MYVCTRACSCVAQRQGVALDSAPLHKVHTWAQLKLVGVRVEGDSRPHRCGNICVCACAHVTARKSVRVGLRPTLQNARPQITHARTHARWKRGKETAEAWQKRSSAFSCIHIDPYPHGQRERSAGWPETRSTFLCTRIQNHSHTERENKPHSERGVLECL